MTVTSLDQQIDAQFTKRFVAIDEDGQLMLRNLVGLGYDMEQSHYSGDQLYGEDQLYGVVDGELRKVTIVHVEGSSRTDRENDFMYATFRVVAGDVELGQFTTSIDGRA